MDLGEIIKRIRKEKNLTLADVSRMADVTTSLLSQIENNKVQPSITSLLSISKALSTPIALFFGDEADISQSPVVRASERPVVRTNSGVTYSLVNTKVQESQLEVLHVQLEKNASTETRHTHAGYECGIVLSGKLEVVVDSEIYVMNVGDSITLESCHPHMLRNIAEGVTTVIWTNTPPSL